MVKAPTLATFDQQYYEDIWGSAHHHDIDNFINHVIDTYNPKRVLDLGTGCGWAVKLLRDKGIEAWGMESSDYAYENSCAKDYVLHQSMLNIPFDDKSFDLVISNGLWEYLKEEDVPVGWAECQRVGERQYHVIDTIGCGIEDDPKAIARTQEWWDERIING